MEYRIGSIGETISGKSISIEEKSTVDFIPIKSDKKISIEDKQVEVKIKKSSRSTTSSNAQRRIENKKRFKENKPTIHNKEEESRTIFVGNLPNYLKKLDVKKLFRKYGKIENIRFRCAPIVDLKISKRIAVIKKEFHPSRTTINAFIRFYDKECAQKSLLSNGEIIDGHHIRVDLAINENPDNKKSIFIGNIPVAAEEEDIWKMFEYCGKVNNVRLIRDRHTGILKGFGYVNFESTDAVEIALKMNGENLKGRELRIQRCKNIKKSLYTLNKSSTAKDIDKNKKRIKEEVVKVTDEKSRQKTKFGGRQTSLKKIKKKKRMNKEDKKKEFIKSKLLPRDKSKSN